MPAFIAPLDAEYISLKRAALLLAHERPGIEPAELMEMFKHALFRREFERSETGIAGIDPRDDRNYPQLRIEAPNLNLNPDLRRLPPEHQPQEYLAATAVTIAQVLSVRDALPGEQETWSTFTSFLPDEAVVCNTLHDLARIPYSAFPAAAQEILGNIVLAKTKLRSWMLLKGYELPSFLEEEKWAVGKEPEAESAQPQAQNDNSDTARGRPCKAGWGRIKQLIRQRHAAHPDEPRSVLAFDAHKLATTEFDENDLPSVGSITRQIKSILATEV